MSGFGFWSPLFYMRLSVAWLVNAASDFIVDIFSKVSAWSGLPPDFLSDFD